MDHPQQSRTSRDELIAELESMLKTLHQCRDGERAHLRPRVPSANNDAASDAEDDIHKKMALIESDMNRIKGRVASLASAGEAGQEIRRLECDLDEVRELVSSNVRETSQKIVRLESELDEMRELVSRSNVSETGQKIVRVEGDVDEMKRELAGLSSVRANLAGLQEQLQMLLNAYMIPGQMYPSAQPPSYN
ncbi:hypothetical protein ARSEF4850_003606 [Beauveria asiatica]